MANLVYEGRVEVRGHKVDGEAGLPDPPEAGPFKRITEREKHGAKVEVGPVDALRACHLSNTCVSSASELGLQLFQPTAGDPPHEAEP